MEDSTTTIADTARPAARSAIERLRTRDEVAGTYPVVIDREWAAEMLAVSEKLAGFGLAVGNKSRQAEVATLEARKAELEERKVDAIIEFKFRHCSPVRFEDLLSKHRPTDEQREQAKLPGQVAPRWAASFRPAFVAEVLISPVLTGDEVLELFGEDTIVTEDGVTDRSLLSPGEAAELFTAAMIASNNVARFEATA